MHFLHVRVRACVCMQGACAHALTTSQPTPLTHRTAVAMALRPLIGGAGPGPVDRPEELELRQRRHAPIRQMGLQVGVDVTHHGMEGLALLQQALKAARGQKTLCG